MPLCFPNHLVSDWYLTLNAQIDLWMSNRLVNVSHLNFPRRFLSSVFLPAKISNCGFLFKQSYIQSNLIHSCQKLSVRFALFCWINILISLRRGFPRTAHYSCTTHFLIANSVSRTVRTGIMSSKRKKYGWWPCWEGRLHASLWFCLPNLTTKMKVTRSYVSEADLVVSWPSAIGMNGKGGMMDDIFPLYPDTTEDTPGKRVLLKVDSDPRLTWRSC